MNFRKMRVFAMAAALAALPLSNGYAATTAGTGFTVQVTVTGGCGITTDGSTVTFATTAGTAAAPADQTLDVGITCTNGTTYSMYVTSANTVTGNTSRIMTNGGTTDTVGYQILRSGTLVGDTPLTGVTGLTGSGLEQTYTLTFHINSWGAVTPATYSDTATLQVDF